MKDGAGRYECCQPFSHPPRLASDARLLCLPSGGGKALVFSPHSSENSDGRGSGRLGSGYE